MTLKRLKPHAKYIIVVLHFPGNLFRSEILIIEDEQSYQQFLASHIWDWREIVISAPVIRYRHWTQKVFMECVDEELEQPIICYIER